MQRALWLSRNAAAAGIANDVGIDRLTVQRARRLQRFLSQPMHVAEVYTGNPGRYVPLKDTIASFKAIVDGEADQLPETAFFMAGDLEDVRRIAHKMEA